MGPKPLYLMKSDIEAFYKVDTRQASKIMNALPERGTWWPGGKKMVSKHEVDAYLKKENK